MCSPRTRGAPPRRAARRPRRERMTRRPRARNTARLLLPRTPHLRATAALNQIDCQSWQPRRARAETARLLPLTPPPRSEPPPVATALRAYRRARMARRCPRGIITTCRIKTCSLHNENIGNGSLHNESNRHSPHRRARTARRRARGTSWRRPTARRARARARALASPGRATATAARRQRRSLRRRRSRPLGARTAHPPPFWGNTGHRFHTGRPLER